MGARSVQPRVPPRTGRLSARRPRAGALALALALALVGGPACDDPPDRGSSRSRADLAELVARPTASPGLSPAPGSASLGSAGVPTAIAPPGRTRPGSPRPELPLPPPRADALELTFVGDVILGRYRDDGFDPIPEGEHELFGEVGALMGSDLVVGNLETPLVHVLPATSPVGTRYSFGADAELARHLAYAGFDVLSLANNHAYDLRGEGVQQTPEILEQLGITAVGAPRAEGPRFVVQTVEREGWRVGFLAFTTHANIPELPGVPPLPLLEVTEIEARLVPLVEQARATHDLVVVLAHWGEEYADTPQWEQRAAAHALVDAGADLVIGHHPHVLQGIERHGRGLVAYSLGNFVFENVKDVPRLSGVLRVRYDDAGCLQDARVHPVFIKSIPIKHPAPATGYMGGQVKERLRSGSQEFGARFEDEGDDLRLLGPGCPSEATPAPRAASAAP